MSEKFIDVNGEKWFGTGWYRVGWSDGGFGDSCFYDSLVDFTDDVEYYNSVATEFHLPYFDYIGDELPDYEDK